jgi:hypothetical protein
MEVIKFHNKTLNDDFKEIITNDYTINKGLVSGNSIEVLYDSTSVSYIYYANVEQRDFDFDKIIEIKNYEN